MLMTTMTASISQANGLARLRMRTCNRPSVFITSQVAPSSA
jgi:hypothetical protein